MFGVTRNTFRVFISRVPSACYFSTSPHHRGPTVAVVLSGSGVYDGSEVHEASAVLVHLTRGGATPVCYAPNIPQMHVIDHSKGAPVEGESRNVLVESARIARGNVKPVDSLSATSADAVVFPGGFGAAKNLSDFGVNGANMKVNTDIERILKEFHAAKKPIALCCIAPMLAAKVFGNGVEITLGKTDDGSGKWPYGGSIEAAKSMGASPKEMAVHEACVDEKNKIVTTPAFMYEGKFHEIFDGVGKMVQKMLEMLK